jgi:general secretion pathway protein E
LIASSVAGVIAQRLVRTFCTECTGKGCKACHEAGFKGRLAINELMTINEEIRDLILGKASSDEIGKAAVKAGMQPMRADGLEKVRQQITSKEEVYRVTQE